MSDPKDFFSRWSRRKLDFVETNEADEKIPPRAEARTEASPAPAKPVPEAEFDLSKLPPLESIGATSDIRAFLQPGVPASLTRAALRRAWSADPAIRDFVGLSENSWDFNAPDSMPGFGSLDPDDIKRLAAQFFSEPDEKDASSRSSQNRHSLDQSAAATGESETPGAHEMRRPVLMRNETPTGDEVQGAKVLGDKDSRADILGAAGQSDQDGAAQYQADELQDESRLIIRRHGGALPK